MTSGTEDKSSSPFPSSHTVSSFFFPSNRVSFDFIEKRRIELDKYWQAVLQIDEMTDFTQSHRYSRDLAKFLSVEKYLPLSSTNQSFNMSAIIAVSSYHNEDKKSGSETPSIKE